MNQKTPDSTGRVALYIQGVIMKFVHLATRKAVGKIRKNGIRKGSGRRGKGVYAVPLVWLPSFDVSRLQRDNTLVGYIGEKFSSSFLWRHLFSKKSCRGKDNAAVVFEANDSIWPADLYLISNPEVFNQFLNNILDSKDMPFERSLVIDQNLQFVCSSFRIHSSKQFGRVFRHLMKTGQAYYSGGSDIIEVVFRNPVPPNHIQRIIPLYPTRKTKRKSNRNDLYSSFGSVEFEKSCKSTPN